MERDGLEARSVEVICGLQEEDGGILATGPDDAYPFVYPRDASFMTMALNRYGLQDRSKKFYRFVDGLRRPGGEVFQRYNKGRPYVTQRGEADVAPIVIQGVYDTYVSSGDKEFLGEMWGLVSDSAAFVNSGIDPRAGLMLTARSVHENQTLEEGFEVWANSAAVRGLVDASRVADSLGQGGLAELWMESARTLWGHMLEKLFDKKTGLFLKNLRVDGTRVTAPDVAQVSPFYFGLTDDRTLLEGTLGHLRKTLWNSEVGGFNRFADFDVVKDWHWYTGGTGASWPLFTLWMARFYASLGDSIAAEECLSFVLRSSSPKGDIAEKVAPTRGYQEWKENEMEFNERVRKGTARAESSVTSIPGYVAWACPLGWSHAEYLRLLKSNGSSKGSLAPLLADTGP